MLAISKRRHQGTTHFYICARDLQGLEMSSATESPSTVTTEQLPERGESSSREWLGEPKSSRSRSK